ncbi:SMI1/KNR4 family protein [Micromonospora sp. U56]|uniref:SMI1/KNR4 family protein n=1 Tax=Micromonospora sp. U56 TaxID=2824900 RepID=UPI001B3780BE|nr:SMI1/KNR4 family protein [Micromonospora sp. U56]MBQ0895466.1 SMI1/KNR4 family protein [Micromonospora sp. U56]
MTSQVPQSWQLIATWLAEHAPLTASEMRPPASPAAIEAVQRQLPVRLPADLVAWWESCDGFTDGAVYALLPEIHVPLCTARVIEARQSQLDLEAKFGSPTAMTGQAGEFSRAFQDAFVPIAEDHCGQLLFVDLRPGPLHGCVSEWDHEQAFLALPIWDSVAAMLTDVAVALQSGTPACLDFARRQRAAGSTADPSAVPIVTPDGELEWSCS